MKKIILFLFVSVFLISSCSNGANNSVYNNDTGKKQVIIWGSTSCPHCVTAMPEFKEKIYDIYKDIVDININSVNGQRFDVDIPQNLNISNMPQFITVVGKECNFVPSFAVIDENNNILLSSCGSEKAIDDIVEVIK